MRRAIFILLAAMMALGQITVFAQEQQQSQPEPKIPKLGKDIEEHLNKNKYQIDTSANAIILFDQGQSSIRYDKDKGYFYLEIKRHKRVKVLTKDGLEWADIAIPLYKSGNTKEELKRLQGATYNLKNGKVTREKISLRSVFTEEVNDRLDLAKFSMPQIKEGSVFEFSYTVVSKFTYNLQPWTFQSRIPTLISYYTVIIPEYYKYNQRVSGYEKINVIKSLSNEIITFSNFDRKQKNIGGVSSQSVEYKTEWQSYYGYNIPALRSEPFTDNIENYRTTVDFELQLTQFPNALIKNYALNWSSVTQDLLQREDFGKMLQSTRFLINDIAELVNNISNPIQKMQTVFEFVNRKIKWDNRYRLFTDRDIKKSYAEGSGNSAEVNLTLVAALREAGLDAFPIILSTRSNGLVQEWEVSLSKFNHVIAGISLGNNIVTLDATNSFSAPNILPLESLNGLARIIDPIRSNWIDLNPKIRSNHMSFVQFNFNQDHNLCCKVNQVYQNYQALRVDNKTMGCSNIESLKQILTTTHDNAIIDSIQISKSIQPIPEVKLSYNAIAPSYALARGNMLYITPGAGLLTTQNPFVSESRKLPMNFHYPFTNRYNFTYTIPEGYKIQELPQDAQYILPDGKGSYSYTMLVNGPTITIMVVMSINQTLFLPEEYPAMKTFYNQIIAKNNEMIVLKKIA